MAHTHRSLVVLVFLCTTASRASAQTPASPALELSQAVTVGQWVVVVDGLTRETRGIVRAVDAKAITVGRRVIATQSVVSVRSTDDLGNGTALGALAGLGVAGAAVTGCSRYEFSEERGLCMASAVVTGLFVVPLAAFVGRSIDKAIGDVEIYRRRPNRAAVRIHPWWRSNAGGVAAAVTW